MLRLLFVRHGRTPWNVQGRVQGGGALDEVGRTQAAALGERLRDEQFVAIYASPALRARQTARAVARRHGMKVSQRHLLRDLDYGRYAGALLADVRAEFPELVAQWASHPDTVKFEEGESLSDLRQRMHQFVKDVQAAHPEGTVLAATHDSPVRTIASIALGLPDSAHNQDDIKTPLASLTELIIENGQWRLGLHRDVEHLRGIDGV